MTGEKRQPREQIATHIYKRSGDSSSRHPAASRSRIPEDMRAEVGSERSRQRKVTRQETVQPSAGDRYVQRRNQMYSARARQEAYSNVAVAPRTFAQTGMPAAIGQGRAIKRLPQYHGIPPTPVPVRSGRRNKRNGGLLWKILGIFFPLVMIILGTNFALTSNAFRITQVSVVGTHNTGLIRSIQHMGMQGQNIFLIDVASLTARIDLLPRVASVNLEKQWPNQLLVKVTERMAALLWQTKYGVYAVDENGVVIAPANEMTGADVLRTVVDMRTTNSSSKGTGGRTLQPGSYVDVADVAFALSVFNRLPQVGVTDFTLRYVTLPAPHASEQSNLAEYQSYVVLSHAGWLAYLGDSNDANPLGNRLMELQRILTLAQQEQLNLATIDLRFGLRPVYTLKS